MIRKTSQLTIKKSLSKYESDFKKVVPSVIGTKYVSEDRYSIPGSNPGVTGGSIGPTPPALRLLFDNINNANTLVGNASSVTDWNIFFDLPNYGNPFTSVEIIGNEVKLYNGSNITLKDNLMNGVFSLIEINDEACITSVGIQSFVNCTSLTAVSLPSVITTNLLSFSNCIALTLINLPSLVTAGAYSFQSCTSLTTVSLPSLISAEVDCFVACTSLTTVNLELAINIKEECFLGCTDLTTINIPSCANLGGTVGDNDVFQNITGNTITLTVPIALTTCNSGNPDGDIVYLQANNTVTIINSAFSLLFNDITNANTLVGNASNVADWNTFFDLPAYGNPFTSVEVIGNEVKLFGGSNITIKEMLFYNNQNILSLLDYNCVFYIGDDAFRNCKFLTSVDFRTVSEVGNYSFGDSENINYLCFPELLIAGNDAFYYNEVITSISALNFPKLVSIGNYCFSEYYALDSINLPELITVGSGPGGSLLDCPSLTIVDLPKLQSVNPNCFLYCDNLTTISLPSCTNLGGTVGDNNVFFYISGNNITLTIPSALMTCNSGNPDGDIQYLQANNTVTIVTV